MVVVGDLMVDVVVVPEGPLAPGQRHAEPGARPWAAGRPPTPRAGSPRSASPCPLVAAVGDDELGRVRARRRSTASASPSPGRSTRSSPPGAAWCSSTTTASARCSRTVAPTTRCRRTRSTRAIDSGRRPGCTSRATPSSARVRTRPRRRALAAARRRGRCPGRSTPPAPPRSAPRVRHRFLRWIDGCRVLFANDDELDALGGVRRGARQRRRGGGQARPRRRVVDRRHPLGVVPGRQRHRRRHRRRRRCLRRRLPRRSPRRRRPGRRAPRRDARRRGP